MEKETLPSTEDLDRVAEEHQTKVHTMPKQDGDRPYIFTERAAAKKISGQTMGEW